MSSLMSARVRGKVKFSIALPSKKILKWSVIWHESRRLKNWEGEVKLPDVISLDIALFGKIEGVHGR